MGTRIDGTTTQLKRMFLNCCANSLQLCENLVDKFGVCDKCVIIEETENYKIIQLEYETEKLQYKFDYQMSVLLKQPKVTNITFIGFCE